MASWGKKEKKTDKLSITFMPYIQIWKKKNIHKKARLNWKTMIGRMLQTSANDGKNVESQKHMDVYQNMNVSKMVRKFYTSC